MFPIVAACAVAGLLVCVATPSALAAAGPFPEPRPGTRVEAVQLLCPPDVPAGTCVRELMLPGSRAAWPVASPALHRSLELLARGLSDPGAEEWTGPQQVRYRFTVDPRSADRLDDADANANGVPDLVETVSGAVARARGLLAGQLELTVPAVREVVFAELGDRVGGYVLPNPDGVTLVLEASPKGGAESAARSAIRQVAYATALELGSMPTDWVEGFASWAETRLQGLDDATARAMSARLRLLPAGLLATTPELAGGNAVWFSFLDQAYGLAAVRVTVDELAGASSVAPALDRALRRAASVDLASAFREFHVWAVLTGDRADGRHFDFASRLDSPGFAATTTGVPTLSVQREPPLGPLGATQVRLVPQQRGGGLRVRFEGDFGASWDVDLLLIGRAGSIHRVALPLGAEGRGEISVPLHDVSDVLLLVREMDSDDGAPRLYTYSTHHEPDFPFSLSAVQAFRPEGERGVVVAWDTVFEQDLVGFNILRRRNDASARGEQPINPVWIPSLGGSGEETSYRFLDPTAEPDVEYVYRIQGITSTGLSAYSDTVIVAPVSRGD